MIKRMISIADHGVHELVAAQLYWGEEDRADEFEVIVAYNGDVVYSRRHFGNPVDMEDSVKALTKEMHRDCGIQLIEVE